MKPPFTPSCPDCGAPWVRLINELTQTCVGYFSDDKHDHDDNCTTMPIECANGHIKRLGIRRACNDDAGRWEAGVSKPPGCDWRGKTECCGDFQYVDAWPEVGQ